LVAAKRAYTPALTKRPAMTELNKNIKKPKTRVIKIQMKKQELEDFVSVINIQKSIQNSNFEEELL
jgi:hypothetical protein